MVCFAEPLEMDDFPLPQEADGIADIVIFHHAQDIIVGSAGFLFRGEVFKKIRNRVPF